MTTLLAPWGEGKISLVPKLFSRKRLLPVSLGRTLGTRLLLFIVESGIPISCRQQVLVDIIESEAQLTLDSPRAIPELFKINSLPTATVARVSVYF